MIRPHEYRQSLWWLMGAIVLLEGGLMIGGVLQWEPWGDERHFVETVRLFAQAPTLDTLSHYPEMSGPLPFALYALWGTLAGLALPALRILSVLIAVASYLLFHRIIWLAFRNARAALLLTILLAAHPYMVGFSVFVFTDGTAILFLLIALLGALRYRPGTLWIGLTGALLSRQYLVFLLPAVLLWAIVMMSNSGRKKKGLSLAAATLAAAVPLALLVTLWGGLSPDNLLRNLYLTDGLQFHPDYLVLYVSLLFLYLLPVVVFSWRQIYGRRIVNAVALVLGFGYWLFPVEASPFAKDIGVNTVGLFHKALVMIGGASWLPQGVFFLGFLLGLPIVLQLAGSAYSRLRSRQSDLLLLCDLAMLLFLITMPFSYLNWEKYLMPLVPIAAIRLAAFRLPPAAAPE